MQELLVAYRRRISIPWLTVVTVVVGVAEASLRRDKGKSRRRDVMQN
jgi:hypothetical protein